MGTGAPPEFGHTPLGFDRVGDELAPNAAEQALLEHIRKEHAAGASLGSIAAKLNAEGLKGKAGGQFYASTIRKLIKASP